ncbi:MAG: hypothetical protein ACE5KE_09240 [Methanosarcinales archaeon]
MADELKNTTKELEINEGPHGEMRISKIEDFAKTILNVYYQTKWDVSAYSKHKPMRILLRGYRKYRNFDKEDRRILMAADLREVLSSPPEGMATSLYKTEDLNSKSLVIVDEFLQLINDLFAGIPSFVTKNENNIIHAYDLALDLHWKEMYIKRLTEKLERLQNKLESEQNEEERSKLIKEIEETQNKLNKMNKGEDD